MNLEEYRRVFKRVLALFLAAICFLLGQTGVLATGTYGYTSLDSWSFSDTNTWTSDRGYAPVSFTNLNFSFFGDGMSLIISNPPVWLQYNLQESNGTTNLTLDQGSISFWYAPSWASTNAGGTGPGVWGRLIEVGIYTNDASLGWWSLYVDDVGANLYFAVLPGDGTTNTSLVAPISWGTNYWHCITLTYCATNTALYLDGALAASGAGITAWPDTNVQSGGFYIGSDSTGLLPAQGAYDDLYTYNIPLTTNMVNWLYSTMYVEYYANPYNWLYMNSDAVASAPSTASFTNTTASTFNVITGSGYLLTVASASNCVTNSNPNTVWITNLVVTATNNGGRNVKFSIAGGEDGYLYDVFANSVLSTGTNGPAWAWMGQGQHCYTYLLTNLPTGNCFLVLGTPKDSDGDGLTDAYELLVSRTNPQVSEFDANGVSLAWYAEYGLSSQAGSSDSDGDGLLNYQEYLYGTKPNVSEGFSIWTGAVNVNSAIP